MYTQIYVYYSILYIILQNVFLNNFYNYFMFILVEIFLFVCFVLNLFSYVY